MRENAHDKRIASVAASAIAHTESASQRAREAHSARGNGHVRHPARATTLMIKAFCRARHAFACNWNPSATEAL